MITLRQNGNKQLLAIKTANKICGKKVKEFLTKYISNRKKQILKVMGKYVFSDRIVPQLLIKKMGKHKLCHAYHHCCIHEKCL